MPNVLGFLPLDEKINIPSVLDELITSPDKFLKTSRRLKTLGPRLGEGGGGTPHNGLHGEAAP